MAEYDQYNFSEWQEAEIEIENSGKAPKKYGDGVYRFGAAMTLSVIMPRRGWELIKKAKNYVYLRPNSKPPFHINIKIPNKQQAFELANMCFEEGESWRGQIGEWPAWYIHKEPGNRYEHVREGDKVHHIPTSEPRSWLHVGEFGVWEIELIKFAGEFGYHEHVKFWKGGKEPISLFDLPLTMPKQTKNDNPDNNPDTFLKKVESFLEGQEITVEQTLYERNPEARRVCINHYGFNCQVCGLNFEKVYGEMGAGFIHVHHINPVSTKGGEYEVNPITDLIPLCPNCHAMAHRRTPPNSIEELRAIYFRE